MKKGLFLVATILCFSATQAQSPYLDFDEQIEVQTMLSKNIKEISITKDKYNPTKVTYRSPISMGVQLMPVFFTRIDNLGESSNVYVYMRAKGGTLNVGKKGVDILFLDGTVLNLTDVSVKPEADSRGYEYTSFFKMTPEMIESFKKSPIDSFRLYIYEVDLDDRTSKQIQNYFKAILSFD